MIASLCACARKASRLAISDPNFQKHLKPSVALYQVFAQLVAELQAGELDELDLSDGTELFYALRGLLESFGSTLVKLNLR